MNLLLVIPFNSGNSAQAEELVDFLYHFNGKKASGAVLLVAANEVHAEPCEKIKISAALAFQHWEMIRVGKITGDQMAGMFKEVSHYIQLNYRSPFFWSEPELRPVGTKWRKQIQDAYESQPKRYLLKKESRIGVYPVSAYSDVTMAESAVNRTTVFDEIFKKP